MMLYFITWGSDVKIVKAFLKLLPESKCDKFQNSKKKIAPTWKVDTLVISYNIYMGHPYKVKTWLSKRELFIDFFLSGAEDTCCWWNPQRKLSLGGYVPLPHFPKKGFWAVVWYAWRHWNQLEGSPWDTVFTTLFVAGISWMVLERFPNKNPAGLTTCQHACQNSGFRWNQSESPQLNDILLCTCPSRAIESVK